MTGIARLVFSLTLGVVLAGCVVRPERQAGKQTLPVSGPTAVDPRWEAFHDYLQRVITAVQKQWDENLVREKLYPPAGSMVRLTFIMDSSGQVTELTKIENTSSEAGKNACVAAITAKSSYRKWSQAMIASLGVSQEMTFTFYYQ